MLLKHEFGGCLGRGLLFRSKDALASLLITHGSDTLLHAVAIFMEALQFV